MAGATGAPGIHKPSTAQLSFIMSARDEFAFPYSALQADKQERVSVGKNFREAADPQTAEINLPAGTGTPVRGGGKEYGFTCGRSGTIPTSFLWEAK